MSNLSGNLSGQSAIVTGASSGMGRATALTLAAAGAKVLAVARREAELKSLQQESAAAGHEISILVADVSKKEDDEAMVKACLEQFGKVDIAVNAAGINLPDRLLEVLTDENWHKLLDINLTGAYYLTRALLGPMEAQGGGLIVHVGSISGRWGDFSGVAYQASKHGLMGLSYGTMMERREKGIRVSVSCLASRTHRCCRSARCLPPGEAGQGDEAPGHRGRGPVPGLPARPHLRARADPDAGHAPGRRQQRSIETTVVATAEALGLRGSGDQRKKKKKIRKN